MFAPESFGLREWTEADLELVLNWRNSERIRNCMYTDQMIAWEEHVAWFQRVRQSKLSRHLIFELDQEPIGVLNFTQIDTVHERCYWGFYLGIEHAPKGAGTLLGFSGLQYAFEMLKVRKLCAEAFSFNTKSVRFHHRLGFQEEGVLRKHFKKNGVFQDIHCFAMFRDDWPIHEKRLRAIIYNNGGTSNE